MVQENRLVQTRPLTGRERALEIRIIVMEILSRRSHQRKARSSVAKCIVSRLVLLFLICCCILQTEHPCASEDTSVSASQNDGVLTTIVNPFNATCYDWEGNIVPCVFKRPYAELIVGNATPDSRLKWHGLYPSNPARRVTKVKKIEPVMFCRSAG